MSSDDFYAYVVLEADVEVAPIAQQPDDATVEELVEVYRALIGEHEDWDAYRKAMVAEQRTVMRLAANRAYGMLEIPGRSGS